MARDLLLHLTAVTVPVLDLFALITIALGTAQAFVALFIATLDRAGRDASAMSLTWVRYSHWLVAGLTFQLAADIIETSATPNWDDIGRLAAIAVIRTFLNYFLEKDLSEIRMRQKASAG